MAEELLERVLRELRERKQAVRGAYEESLRLERALVALGPAPSGSAGRGGRVQRGPRARRGRAAPGANRERILAVVAERPGATAGEIALASGIARATVTTTLRRLAETGEVQRSESPGAPVGFRLLHGQDAPAAGVEPASDVVVAPAAEPPASD